MTLWMEHPKSRPHKDGFLFVQLKVALEVSSRNKLLLIPS